MQSVILDFLVKQKKKVKTNRKSGLKLQKKKKKLPKITGQLPPPPLKKNERK